MFSWYISGCVDGELVTRRFTWADLEIYLVTLGDLHAKYEGKQLHQTECGQRNRKWP